MAATIICAIQEETAETVARTGGELARGLEARLVLAHVQKDPALFNSTTELERARHRARRRGRETLRRAQAVVPDGVETDARVELGVPAIRLAESAAEIGAGLIVVGRPGRGRLASALPGSVSKTLARQSPCPVVVLSGAATAALGMPEECEGRRAA